MSDLLVVGIQGVMRTHPMPRLDNFVIADWNDRATIDAADVFIQANIKECKHKGLHDKYQYIIDSGKPWICAESPVFRKNLEKTTQPYHRWSWWSYFRDEGDYVNDNSPSDRWEQISQEQNLIVEPWQNNPDGHILLCLQRPGDSSLHRILAKRKEDYPYWIWKTIKEIRRYTDRKIVIRPHPLRLDQTLNMLSSIIEDFANIEISLNHSEIISQGGGSGGSGFAQDLEGAYCAVGLNSNALTETVMAGIPTFSLCSGAMAWPVSNHELKYIESPQLEFDRTQWLYDLSYCQWREDEIEKGLPWIHLSQRIPQLIR